MKSENYVSFKMWTLITNFINVIAFMDDEILWKIIVQLDLSTHKNESKQVLQTKKNHLAEKV